MHFADPTSPLAACILNQCPLTVHRLEPGDITSSHNKTSFYPFPSSGVWYPALTNKTNTENYYCLQIIINHYHYVNNVPICIPFYNNTMSCTIYSNINSNVIQQTMKPMSGQTAESGWGGVKAVLALAGGNFTRFGFLQREEHRRSSSFYQTNMPATTITILCNNLISKQRFACSSAYWKYFSIELLSKLERSLRKYRILIHPPTSTEFSSKPLDVVIISGTQLQRHAFFANSFHVVSPEIFHPCLFH